MITEGEFQKQYARLIETYGKNAFGTERAKLFWTEARQFNKESIERIIGNLIATHRQPPLLPEFRDAAAVERERLWNIEKQQNKDDAKAFFEGSTYSDMEQAGFFDSIIKRINGEMPDRDFNGMVSVMKNAAKGR